MQTLAAIPGLDPVRGVALMGDNHALYLRQLRNFIELRGRDALLLRERLGAEDIAGLGDVAHMLAGSAGTIGAGKVHAAAVAVQIAVRQRAPRESLGRAVEVLAAEVTALIDNLGAALGDT